MKQHSIWTPFATECLGLTVTFFSDGLVILRNVIIFDVNAVVFFSVVTHGYRFLRRMTQPLWRTK